MPREQVASPPLLSFPTAVEEFYRLSRHPFTRAPDPEHIYLSPQVEEALARLEHAAEVREIAVLTGEIGVGKTTITRALVDRLENGSYHIVWIMHPRLSPPQLLELIALRLDLPTLPKRKVALLDAISTRVYELWREGRTMVLLFDEAQLLPGDTLEEIRLLTNIQADEENLFATILVGQPEFRRRLDLPRFRALAQRIGIRYHIVPMEAKEVKEYLTSRVKSAGRHTPLFTDAAVEAIVRYSRGIPRVINHLCANLLIHGYLQEEDPLGAASVDHVAQELGLVT